MPAPNGAPAFVVFTLISAFLGGERPFNFDSSHNLGELVVRGPRGSHLLACDQTVARSISLSFNSTPKPGASLGTIVPSTTSPIPASGRSVAIRSSGIGTAAIHCAHGVGEPIHIQRGRSLNIAAPRTRQFYCPKPRIDIGADVTACGVTIER